jgi:hypothetical protein
LQGAELQSAERQSAEDAATHDPRTPDQRRHDAFAEIVMAAAASDGAPRLDGQTVTVLVTVSADDLANPEGLDGDAIGTMSDNPHPISRRAVERFIDAGGFRTVARDTNGAVIGISSPQRCFTPLMRMAISARDGNRCARPGCTSRSFALQVHHVRPARDGGPTSTNNGILLCFGCHQQVDSGPWEYRMVEGMPQVRGPGLPDWVPLRAPVRRAA